MSHGDINKSLDTSEDEVIDILSDTEDECSLQPELPDPPSDTTFDDTVPHDLYVNDASLKKATRELYKLQFRGAGRKVDLPELGSGTGSRLRPRHSKNNKDSKASKDSGFRSTAKCPVQYDQTGCSLVDVEGGKQEKCDLCDCLDYECPGCFFVACQKCASFKCGTECRINRKGGPAFIRTLSANPKDPKETRHPMLTY